MAHSRRKFSDPHSPNDSYVADDSLRCMAWLYAIEQDAASMTPLHADPCGRRMPSCRFGCWPSSALLPSAAVRAQQSSMPLRAGRRWSATPLRSRPGRQQPDRERESPDRHRKNNWFFAGSGRAGRCAAIHSVFAAIKLDGLHPARWLRETQENCRPARTTRSTRYCYLRTPRQPDSSVKVGRLDAYEAATVPNNLINSTPAAT